jgi:uncharacterized repeat protein (TIGR03803 family)
MRHERFFMTIATFTAALTIIMLVTTAGAAAQTPTVLHSFTGPDGISPILGLTMDSAGNLYGVASEGGSSNNGTVFELKPGTGGTWTETTLYSFNGAPEGSTPLGTPVLDSAGNLFGTTKLGGSHGVGTVYEVTKSGTAKVLYSFGGSSGDGQYPTGSIVFDKAGNLYGTTEGGGAYGDGSEYVGGTAFQLAPKSGGGWRETAIHSFGNGTDGLSPRAGVIIDTAGNLYGTTFLGGANSEGAVFEVSPQSGGGWKEQVLYSIDPFNGQDGFRPLGGLVFDSAGNLYGTTSVGGTLGGGTVFKLSESGGTWTEAVIYGFQGAFFEPALLSSSLVFDTAGNLYGTTLLGGKPRYGSIYKMAPQAGGIWVETPLYQFDGAHGSEPAVGTMIFHSGKLYGATQAGGANKDGAVFSITP